MPTLNTLFAIIAVSNAAALEARFQTIAPWLYLKVADGQWILIAPSATTSKEVSDRMGITAAESISNGIVLRVDGYFGRYAPSVWEWINTKLGADLGAA